VPKNGTRLALVGAFVICIALGFGLALVLKDRLGGGTAAEDPCLGRGELIEKWQHEVTQEDIDNASGSRPELRSVTPGMIEYRRCWSPPGNVVTIDEKGNIYNVDQPTLEQLGTYYNEHPDEHPAVKAREQDQKAFVPSGLPQDQTAGCDPTWVKTTIDSMGVVVCHPADWEIQEEEEAGPYPVWIGTDKGHIGVFPRDYVPPDSILNFACDAPELLDTPYGAARLCTMGWDPVGGQSFGLFLPNERPVVANTIEREGKDIVIRVAVNVEDLP